MKKKWTNIRLEHATYLKLKKLAKVRGWALGYLIEMLIKK
jgi:predicted DNA-binding ribbon-helix-helix protein